MTRTRPVWIVRDERNWVRKVVLREPTRLPRKWSVERVDGAITALTHMDIFSAAPH